MKKFLIFLGIAGAIGATIYYVTKKKGSSYGSPEKTGLGVGGAPRRGRPKTEEERLATHKARFGTSELPPRGTGLSRQGII